MNDYTPEQINDSKNSNHGAKNTVQCTGVIGHGQQFDSSKTKGIVGFMTIIQCLLKISY